MATCLSLPNAVVDDVGTMRLFKSTIAGLAVEVARLTVGAGRLELRDVTQFVFGELGQAADGISIVEFARINQISVKAAEGAFTRGRARLRHMCTQSLGESCG